MNSALKNPLLEKSHSDARSRICQLFPELSACRHENFLYLRKYLDVTPSQFFLPSVHQEFASWLSKRASNQGIRLQQYINDHCSDISRALMHLDEINSLPWHDESMSGSDIDKLRFIDQFVHPAYLRLIEGVFAPLLHPVAYFSRLDRGKDTSGLDVWNIVDEVKRSDLAGTTTGYDNTMRNGIAHGCITYLDREIRYQDKKGNEQTIVDSDVIHTFDVLLDTCNGISSSLGVLLALRASDGYSLPQHILYEELRARTATPYWRVDACIPSTAAAGNQLIIYAHTSTRDYRNVQTSAFQTGMLAGVLAPGYARYFISLRSSVALPGWAAFDGKRISALIKQGAFSILDCADVLEDGLVYYVPKPRLPRVFSILNTFLLVARLNLPIAAADFRKTLGLAAIQVRNASVHRNGWRSVVRGEVVVTFSNGGCDQEGIRKSLRRIVGRAAKEARRRVPIWSATRYLPLGLIYLSVFRKNYRKRRLSGFGLGSDLVCTVRIKRISRIRMPDISGSVIEQQGKYRVAWNRQWLDQLSPEDEVFSGDV